jgi:hypothetical protein
MYVFPILYYGFQNDYVRMEKFFIMPHAGLSIILNQGLTAIKSLVYHAFQAYVYAL